MCYLVKTSSTYVIGQYVQMRKKQVGGCGEMLTFGDKVGSKKANKWCRNKMIVPSDKSRPILTSFDQFLTSIDKFGKLFTYPNMPFLCSLTETQKSLGW